MFKILRALSNCSSETSLQDCVAGGKGGPFVSHPKNTCSPFQSGCIKQEDFQL